jgi:hypothetical protein
MQIAVSDSMLPHIPWHDADVEQITIERLTHGDVIVRFNLGLNDEEDFEYIASYGISTHILAVAYVGVWSIQSDIRGDIIPREVITDWQSVVESNELQTIRERNGSSQPVLRHHRIAFSGGSWLSIMFEHLYINHREES